MSTSKIVLLLVTALVCAIAAYLLFLSITSSRSAHDDEVPVAAREQVRFVLSARAERDATVWKQEIAAQRYESFFVQLWDRMRKSQDALAILATVPLQAITLGDVASQRQFEHGIDLVTREPGDTVMSAEWTELVRAAHAKGYRLVQSEWHHSRFEQDGPNPRSTVTVALHVVNDVQDERLVIKGDLIVDWFDDDGQLPRPKTVDTSRLEVQRRKGKPFFRLAAALPAKRMGATDFLGAYDLDGDGLSEILFGEHVFHNRGNGQFAAAPVSARRNMPLQSAAIADFNGDGRVDLLCADPRRRPQLFLADRNGRFEEAPREIDAVDPINEFSTSITVGDVNADGHLDVWLSQYKRPYHAGQMPTPYYDANDGYPAYLLINDGHGNFVDKTEVSGLAQKRRRRTYSSSLVDLDADSDLDLVVVSDFAGLDIYRNDGRGKFRDVTRELVDEPHNFGMSHVIADFDSDGQLDLFVCGMGSTTARRLDAMGVGPPEHAVRTKMRAVMGYGNRMYLARDGRFEEPSFRDQVARTGWSWGVAEFDFDNDGDRDIYVGNGHISGPSVRDYCSVFWRHDIYAGTSEPNLALEQLFLGEQERFHGRGSWNGYEHNCLLMNQAGSGFVEVAFLLGLAHEFDTRSVVADDIDGNGLVDLLVIQRPVGQPATLQVWKNYCEDAGHWIGVVLCDEPGLSVVGARVVVNTEQGDRIAQVVNGDSFNCQHAATLHFGLGVLDQVKRIQITWPNGKSLVVSQPSVDTYHKIRQPL